MNKNGRVAKVFITYKGKRKTVLQWASEMNLKPQMIYGRIKRGVKGEKLFEPPKRNELKMVRYKGRVQSVMMLAIQKGLPPATVRTRLSKGWTLREALDTPTVRYSPSIVDENRNQKSESVRMICFYNLHKTISKLHKDFQDNIPYYLKSDFGKSAMKVA